jgi:hypothetical protein
VITIRTFRLILLVLLASLLLPRAARSQTPESDPVFVGAGDIAECGNLGGSQQTASLLDQIDGTVFTAGDNAYNAGTAQEFRRCYEPTWGRHKARTRPAPGNHDYGSPGALPYYTYFGENAGPDRRGYYSFDLGAWHIISLNSNIPVGAGSPQEKWLRADLAAHQAVCTLAIWHHPLFSSGPHGNNTRMKDLWQALYDFGADVVINGHDHDYERFAPQEPNGKADPQGIREFVVGTGGASPYPFILIKPNSEVRRSYVYSVLKLTLHPTGYDWEFISTQGQKFGDSGTADCHN